MHTNYPLSLLGVQQSELQPGCADHSADSSSDNIGSPLQTAQAQHSTALLHGAGVRLDPFNQYPTAPATIAEEGMSERKRNSACYPTDPNVAPPTATNPTDSPTLTAEVKLLGRVTSPKQPTTKKRRVSFCQTTKPPSASINQGPLNSIQKLSLSNNITMKHSASCTSLPELSSLSSLAAREASTDELDLTVSPATFINTIVLQSRSITGSIRGEDIISDAIHRVKNDAYFLPFTAEHLEAYTHEKVNAVQANDVETLRSLLNDGHLMQASNRFGESMLHTSCRRGFTETVEFFVNEAKVSPRIRDDMGRTPMHDVCWSSATPNHNIMRILIGAAPELLLSKDKRGHSPFDYARREYWPNWVTFLNEHRQLIVDSLVSSFLESSEYSTCGNRFSGGGLGGTGEGNLDQ